MSAATVTEAPVPTPATVSAPDLLRAVRVTRALQSLLEAALWLVVGGSMLPFAAVHARAFTVPWMACLAAASIAVARAVAVSGLRQRLGPHRAALHASGSWVVVEPHPADRALGWSIDLAEPALPRGPLLLPGLALLALLALQLVPLAGGPVSHAPEVTRRGTTFVVACLLVHVTAAAAFAHRPARGRFRAALTWFGAVLALVSLVQPAGGRPVGALVNRNHLAGYMLLVVPVALSLFADAWRAYVRRVGEGVPRRRALVSLGTPEGIRLVWAALPPLLAIAALLASSSRAADDHGQLLVETGVPGLLVGLWTGLAALAAARRDPWLFAALAGGLMLAFVDFDAQVPAIAALFVALAALGGRARTRSMLLGWGGGGVPARKTPPETRRPS